MNKKAPDCVELYGVPKSGTTWLGKIEQSTRVISCSKLKKTECQKCSDPSHHKHSFDEITKTKGIKYFLFIIRDPRDVVVSTYHWFNRGITPISNFVRSKEYGIQNTIRRLNNFCENIKKLDTQKNKHYRIIFYEMLKKYEFQEIEKISKFLNLKLDKNDINQVIENTSFESMRETEIKGEMHLKIYPKSSKALNKAINANKTANDLFHVMTRKGEVGGYKDEINATTVEYIEQEMRLHLDPILLKIYLPSEDYTRFQWN
jgi:hypothetical protein